MVGVGGGEDGSHWSDPTPPPGEDQWEPTDRTFGTATGAAGWLVSTDSVLFASLRASRPRAPSSSQACLPSRTRKATLYLRTSSLAHSSWNKRTILRREPRLKRSASSVALAASG